MAKFEGTPQEFHEFLGPRIRNKINNLTRLERKKQNGKCQHCGEPGELQSAHQHGRERRVIIEKVLSSYKNSDGFVVCDIAKVEKEILGEHKPLKVTFLFLCPTCHRKYDKGHKDEENISSDKNNVDNKKKGQGKINQPMNNEQLPRAIQSVEQPTSDLTYYDSHAEFKYIHRIKLWAEKPHQINHKIIRAYLSLEEKGAVNLDNLRRLCSVKGSKYYVDTFNSNYAQMKTDLGHPHGKVFYDDGVKVNVYPPVLDEIRKWFR